MTTKERQREIEDASFRHRGHWTCVNGHRSEVYLAIVFYDTDQYTVLQGSSWDWCDACSEMPNIVQRTRMTLGIFARWLKAGIIGSETYHSLAQREVTRTR